MSEVEERTETSVELGRRAAERAESRMLIDGELAPAASGEEFDNLSPATGLVLGRTGAAGAQDMDRAIAAARRAFDESDWSTNRALRKRCLEQLQAAIEADKERSARGADRRGRLSRHDNPIRATGLAVGRRRCAIPPG